MYDNHDNSTYNPECVTCELKKTYTVEYLVHLRRGHCTWGEAHDVLTWDLGFTPEQAGVLLDEVRPRLPAWRAAVRHTIRCSLAGFLPCGAYTLREALDMARSTVNLPTSEASAANRA